MISICLLAFFGLFNFRARAYSRSLFFLLSFFYVLPTHSQSTSQPARATRFQRLNAKAQAFFKVAPVPIISYSTEAGRTLGLAKFNVFHPIKSDTLSAPSRLSEVATFSTKGRVNFSVASDLILKDGKFMFLTTFNYRKLPEYIVGIGNAGDLNNIEQVFTNRIKFTTTALKRIKKHYYTGLVLDVANYFDV